MNYYEHHIGDYAEATAHLTFIEDAAYGRLIRKYYATEQPLPCDPKAVQRLVGARSKAEKQAVLVVLEEFFDLREDGWHNARCDDEIARFNEFDVERQAKNENEKERKRRSRERRTKMFDSLRDHGIVPKYDASIGELESLLARVTSGTGHAHVTVGSRDRGRGPDATGTGSHFPLPTSHISDANASDAGERARDGATEQDEDHGRPPDVAVTAPTADGAMALALRKLGVQVTSQHPTLLAWIKDGFSLQTTLDATALARISKPWPEAIPANYLDKVLRNPKGRFGKGNGSRAGPGGKSIDELIDEACDLEDAAAAAVGES